MANMVLLVPQWHPHIGQVFQSTATIISSKFVLHLAGLQYPQVIEMWSFMPAKVWLIEFNFRYPWYIQHSQQPLQSVERNRRHVKSGGHLLDDELNRGWSMPIILVLLSIYLQNTSRYRGWKFPCLLLEPRWTESIGDNFLIQTLGRTAEGNALQELQLRKSW